MQKLKNSKKINTVLLLSVVMALAVILSVSATLAYFFDRGSIGDEKGIKFGAIEINESGTDSIVWSSPEAVDLSKFFPGNTATVKGTLTSKSVGDFYIYLEPELVLQKYNGSWWEDLGEIYQGEEDSEGVWTPTTNSVLTISNSLGILNSITGDVVLVDNGWTSRPVLFKDIASPTSQDYDYGLYEVDIQSAGNIAHNLGLDNSITEDEGYQHDIVIESSINFSGETGNVVFYKNELDQDVQLTLNEIKNVYNHYRFSFKITFNAIQKKNFYEYDQNNLTTAQTSCPDLFTQDTLWANNTKDLGENPEIYSGVDYRDVYEYLSVYPIFTGEYLQWTHLNDSSYWSYDSLTKTISPTTTCKTLLNVYVPGYIKLSSGEKIGKYDRVNKLNNYAFQDVSVVNQTITIGTGITIIGDGAFYNSKINSIVLSKTVTIVRDFAFRSCTSLTSVNLNTSVVYLGLQTFRNCTSLIAINIPDSVCFLGTQLFYECTNLTNVTGCKNVAILNDSTVFPSSNCYVNNLEVENNVAYLGGICFGYVGSKPTGAVNIRQGTRSISYSAFENCTGITSLTLPEGLVNIYQRAFNGCSTLHNVNCPSTLIKIDSRAFYNCPITNFSLNDGLEYIGSNAFWGSLSSNLITSINLPQSLTYLGDYAFLFTYNVQGTMSIPKSLSYIGAGVFSGSKISKYNVSIDNVNYKDIEGVLYSKDGTVLIAYPRLMSNSIYFVPEGTTIIQSFAFAYIDTNYLSLILPSSLVSINSHAFRASTKLTINNIPESVQTIGVSAFYNCSTITSLYIPSGVTSLTGTETFQNMTSLATLYINSQSIATALTSNSACGNLLSNSATTAVYINSTFTNIGSALTLTEETITFNNVEYTKYTKVSA